MPCREADIYFSIVHHSWRGSYPHTHTHTHTHTYIYSQAPLLQHVSNSEEVLTWTLLYINYQSIWWGLAQMLCSLKLFSKLHHSEVPRGTTSYYTCFEIAPNLQPCLNRYNILINWHRVMKLSELKAVS